MSTLLLVQPAPVWSDSYIQTILQSLLNFTVHTKPKVRKGEGEIRQEKSDMCLCFFLLAKKKCSFRHYFNAKERGIDF